MIRQSTIDFCNQVKGTLPVKIPSQADAIKFDRKVGGKAFPTDYNWLCPAGHWSRKFEQTCYSCEVDIKLARQHGVTVSNIYKIKTRAERRD